MKKWGIFVTAFYVVVVLCLIIPGAVRISVSDASITEFYLGDDGAFQLVAFWVWLGILVGGQVSLLFLSVDSSAKRLKPRQHILLSVATIAILIALLTGAAFYSVLAGVFTDQHSIWEALLGSNTRFVATILVLWAFWGVVFYLYAKGKPIAITGLMRWLVKGSVLELLIAVPCHVIVRRRGDCSAPFVTGYGIATGLAIMLLSFGPSVLFLYQKRLRQYKRPIANRASAGGADSES